MSSVNFKPARPLALHELSQKLELEYKNSQQENVTMSSDESKESAKHLALEFGKKSTIHSMNRILQENSNIYERFFWLLTLVSALLGSIYVCLLLSQRFNAGFLQTVVDTTNKPVFDIPFPEVTICNENHLNWDRIEEAKQRFMPHENNMEKIRLFEFVIGLYDNLKFGEFKAFSALEGKPMALVNGINFSQVFDFMTWRCEDLLTNCAWQYFEINCCDIFLRTTGPYGLCWHFNTLSSQEGKTKMLKDSKYPWRTGSAGTKSGLSLRVLINPEKHYNKSNDKGISVIITEPTVYSKEAFWIPANTETAIEVEPVIYYYDNGTRGLSSASRQCLFNNEHTNEEFKYLAGFPYMFENCETQCRQEYLLKYCNCTMDLLFPYDGYPVCKAEDLFCLAKHNDYFRSIYQFGEEKFVKTKLQGMVCKCFRNCFSLNYLTDARPSFLPRYLRENQSFIDLDVYYRFEKMMVYRTSLVVSWVDLMVAFGGIVGLFLGCSLISGIELLYFALVQLPVFMFNKLTSKSKNKQTRDVYGNELHLKNASRKRCKWTLNKGIRAVKKVQQDDLYAYGNNFNRKNYSVQKYNLLN